MLIIWPCVNWSSLIRWSSVKPKFFCGSHIIVFYLLIEQSFVFIQWSWVHKPLLWFKQHFSPSSLNFICISLVQTTCLLVSSRFFFQGCIWHPFPFRRGTSINVKVLCTCWYANTMPYIALLCTQKFIKTF
jgi:hypothetical protein